uniref:Uncharacterized protein n=1 Tax=Nelumbo nucifera TaxID=4432 RepID=A0A822ZF90_NELNU|nr:TPA_asm: hypothetical protein HUJ06_000651 [Nelumbo nucifera]
MWLMMVPIICRFVNDTQNCLLCIDDNSNYM